MTTLLSPSEMGNTDNLKTTEIVGKRLKYLIKYAIKDGKYKSQQDFFDCVQSRIDASGNPEKASVAINNQNTYSKYLNGGTNMKLDVLKHICLELGCTADYLLGVSPVNRNFLGSAYMLVRDMGFEISCNPENEDEIGVMFNGQLLEFSYDELKAELENIFEYTLYRKSTKK